VLVHVTAGLKMLLPMLLQAGFDGTVTARQVLCSVWQLQVSLAVVM
jgi:hypothetical protein